MRLSDVSEEVPVELQADDAYVRVRATVRNDALAPLSSVTLAADFEVVNTTVAGDRTETKRVVFATDPVVLLPSEAKNVDYVTADLRLYKSATFKNLVLANADFFGGGGCRDGKLTPSPECIVPVDRKIMGELLGDSICTLDKTISDKDRESLSATLRVKFAKKLKGQPAFCPDREAQAYFLAGDRARLPPALKIAQEHCPGVIGSFASAPDFWALWPCPDCFSACTGLTPAKASANDLAHTLEEVASFRGCITRCSKTCDAASIQSVVAMIESDRLYNWPAELDATKATTPIATLFGIALATPASKSLSKFSAKPNPKIHAKCGREGIECFDLELPGDSEDLPYEHVRAATKDDRIVLLSFQLQYVDFSDPAAFAGWLRKKYGQPVARYDLLDKRVEMSVFAETGPGIDNVLLGRWKADGGEVDANGNDIAPSDGTARRPELIYFDPKILPPTPEPAR